LDVTRDGGSIVVKNSKTVYLTLPYQLVDKLESLGFDFVHKKNRIEISVNLANELEGDGPKTMTVVYSLTKLAIQTGLGEKVKG
jgi:hypothetical protein